MNPEVIYEDEDFLVVNKPAGLLVHGHARSTEKTLVDWLLEKCPEVKTVGDDPENRPGIVHRLDKDTSGVMIVAKNQASFEYLKNLFKKHEIKKTYLALVLGVPKENKGIIDLPIGIKSGTTKRSVHSKKMAKEAVTEYRLKKEFISGDKRFSLLEVSPKTGRTHQIRVHLSSIGHPVIGDNIYGRKEGGGFSKRLMLHALSIEWSTRNGKRMKIEAEPPHDFVKVLQNLVLVE